MLTQDEIIWGYRYALGRDPDPGALEAHKGSHDIAAFRRILLESYEFRTLGIGPYAENRWVLAQGPVPGNYIWADVADRGVGYDVIYGKYEPTLTKLFGVLANESNVILDIGANIGWYTLLACNLSGPAGSVLAFEPNPIIAGRLQKSVDLNGYGARTSVKQEALSNRSGTGLLARPTHIANYGNAFIFDEADQDLHECFEVPLVRLDELNLPHVDLIKMDCEGAEPQVIEGGKDTISRCRPIIISEVFDDQLRKVSQSSASDYIDKIFHLDYAAYFIEHDKVISTSEGWLALNDNSVTNVVFVPKERWAEAARLLNRVLQGRLGSLIK